MDMSLLRPLWLFALPLLALTVYLLRHRRARLGDWERVIDPALMAALSALGRVERTGSGRQGLAALGAAAIIVLALAGPAVERRDAAAFRNLDGVVFVLDASPSVTEADIWSAIQTMGRFGVASLGTRPAALIIYAGDAYVATDMTADTRQLGLTLSLVGPGTVPDPGSRPALGLAMAARALDEAQVLAGDVILLTDGEGLGPAAMDQAATIAAQGARLSVVSSDITPKVETLAAAGNGQVFGIGDAEAFAAYLAQSGRERLEKQDYPLLFRADRGRFLLIIALVLVLPLFARRA